MTDPTVVQQPTPASPAQPAAEPPRKSLSELASDMFGSNFHGEVEKAPPVETEEPKPDDAKEGEAPPVEEPTEGEEPEEGEVETAPADGTGEMPIATVSELVEHLEADPSWFKTLKMSFNVDGMPTEATIAELVDSYQLRGAAEHRFETAKQIAQKEQEVWAAKQQQAEEQVRVSAELVKAAEASLDRDVKAVDPRLRDEDPAEWAARVQEFNERRGTIERMKSDTVAAYRASAEARAKEFQNQRQTYLDQQRQVLLEKLPEWRDTEHQTQEQAELIDYLQREGFAQAELENLVDHRQLLMARKAMLYDKSRGQVDTAKKRVAKVPKMMKSGAPKSKEQLSSERLEQLRSKMARTGTMEDALAYRLAKRGVSR